jgi:RNA polymerase sigma factor for flagellar operon FliA
MRFSVTVAPVSKRLAAPVAEDATIALVPDPVEDVDSILEVDADLDGEVVIEVGVGAVVRAPRKPVDPAVLALWDDYKTYGRVGDRDRLILEYTGLVKLQANRLRNRLPASIEQADLVSYGMFGLIDAIEKFEPERNLKFETYAMTRIRGAIIDELRSTDWVPRSVRTKMRDIDRAAQALEVELSRTPTEVEIAERLNISLADLRAIYSQASVTNVVALDELMHRGGDGDDAAVTLGDRLTDERVEQPGDALEAEETKRALRTAIAALPERDRIVIGLYYFEKLTLAEIGQVLKVTESRVCQLHTKSVSNLRAQLVALAEGTGADEVARAA